MNHDHERKIHIIINRQQEAWNRQDPVMFSQDCDREISFTNILGQVFFGKGAFEARHAQIFDTIFKGSRLSMSLRRMHFPAPNLALVDIGVALSSYQGLPPGVSPSPDGVLHTALLQVFILSDDGWRVAAYHNVDLKGHFNA